MAGAVLLCGGSDWDCNGRKKEGGPKFPDLPTPHLVKLPVSVTSAHTGPNSCHNVLIDVNGEAWVFGRNERGQLGLGDLIARQEPVKLSSNKQYAKLVGHRKVVTAAVGRNHTILVLADGAVVAAGENKSGQLGVSTLVHKTEFVEVKKLSAFKVVSTACGADFTIVLLDNGDLMSFGSPEYGQLGHGSDKKYLATGNKLIFDPQPDPQKIFSLSGKKIVEIACGTNHSLARDEEGRVYSWGFGGYGRLGHGEQKDLFVPQEISYFSSKTKRAKRIACGTTCSLALDELGQYLVWGKFKLSGDGSSGSPWTHPKPISDLMGYPIKDLAAGGVTLFAILEKEVASWGQNAFNGENGHGVDEPRSSAKPRLAEPFEGMLVKRVSCGLSHTLVLVDDQDPKLSSLPTYPVIIGETEAEEDAACFICNLPDDKNGDSTVLLCDSCDSGIHLACSDPPLTAVPEGDFFCNDCRDGSGKGKKRKADAAAAAAAIAAAAAAAVPEKKTRGRKKKVPEGEADESSEKPTKKRKSN